MAQNLRQILQEEQIANKGKGKVLGVRSCHFAKFLLFWGSKLSVHSISAVCMIMESRR